MGREGVREMGVSRNLKSQIVKNHRTRLLKGKPLQDNERRT